MLDILKMPANYDMLVSHSPPVFSHSPPAGFLSDYTNAYRYYDPLRGFCRPQSNNMSPIQNRKIPSSLHLKMPTSPKKSCLAHHRNNTTNSEPGTPEYETPTTPESLTESLENQLNM